MTNTKQKTKLLNVRIDAQLHRDFKLTCIKNSVSMLDVTESLIQDYILKCEFGDGGRQKCR